MKGTETETETKVIVVKAEGGNGYVRKTVEVKKEIKNPSLKIKKRTNNDHLIRSRLFLSNSHIRKSTIVCSTRSR